CFDISKRQLVRARYANVIEVKASAAVNLILDRDSVIRERGRIEVLACVARPVRSQIGRRITNGASRLYICEEISVFLQLISDATLALDYRRKIHVPFAFDGQQIALRLFVDLVVFDGDTDLWAHAALQKNLYGIPFRISLDSRIVEHRRKVTGGDKRVADTLHVVAQRVASKRSVRLKSQRITNRRLIEPGDLNVKLFNFRLFARGNFVSNRRPKTT